MPSYRYEIRESSGAVTQGVLSAANLGAASQELRSRGGYILALAPTDGSDRRRKGLNLEFSFGPSQKDVQGFTSQLAVMIRAGISLRAAVEGISDQIVNPKFKVMLSQMKKDLESGKQFSDALMRYPKVFSPLYVNMVKASELSGGFSKMLDRIAVYLTQQIETKSMVSSARPLIFPDCFSSTSLATTSAPRATRVSPFPPTTGSSRLA